MKHLLLLLLPGIFILQFNNNTDHAKRMVLPAFSIEKNDLGMKLNFQDEQSPTKMAAIVFRDQQYCRAELKDFEFDVKFTIVSATVYFTGKNFDHVEKGFIKSNSLKPIEDQKKRCGPGTIVVFDDVKVLGPDKEIRTIPGLTLQLY